MIQSSTGSWTRNLARGTIHPLPEGWGLLYPLTPRVETIFHMIPLASSAGHGLGHHAFDFHLIVGMHQTQNGFCGQGLHLIRGIAGNPGENRAQPHHKSLTPGDGSLMPPAILGGHKDKKPRRREEIISTQISFL